MHCSPVLQFQKAELTFCEYLWCFHSERGAIHADWTMSGNWMSVERQSTGSSRITSASSRQMDAVLPVRGICVQWHRPYDSLDLYSGPWPSLPLMTSTDPSTRERIVATLKRPLVCLNILTCIQIFEQKRRANHSFHSGQMMSALNLSGGIQLI